MAYFNFRNDHPQRTWAIKKCLQIHGRKLPNEYIPDEEEMLMYDCYRYSEIIRPLVIADYKRKKKVNLRALINKYGVTKRVIVYIIERYT